MIANAVISVPDASLDMTGTGTTSGTTTAKGTATDLSLTVLLANRGTQTLAGTYTITVQGTNDNTTFTTVTPDKGTLPAATNQSAGAVTVHFAQLQYANYRTTVATTSPAGTLIPVYSFQNISDSVKNTVQ